MKDKRLWREGRRAEEGASTSPVWPYVLLSSSWSGRCWQPSAVTWRKCSLWDLSWTCRSLRLNIGLHYTAKARPLYVPISIQNYIGSVTLSLLFLPSGGEALKSDGLITTSPGLGTALPPLPECLKYMSDSTFSWKILPSRIGKSLEVVKFLKRIKRKINFKSKSLNTCFYKPMFKAKKHGILYTNAHLICEYIWQFLPIDYWLLLATLISIFLEFQLYLVISIVEQLTIQFLH